MVIRAQFGDLRLRGVGSPFALPVLGRQRTLWRHIDIASTELVDSTGDVELTAERLTTFGRRRRLNSTDDDGWVACRDVDELRWGLVVRRRICEGWVS